GIYLVSSVFRLSQRRRVALSGNSLEIETRSPPCVLRGVVGIRTPRWTVVRSAKQTQVVDLAGIEPAPCQSTPKWRYTDSNRALVRAMDVCRTNGHLIPKEPPGVLPVRRCPRQKFNTHSHDLWFPNAA